MEVFNAHYSSHIRNILSCVAILIFSFSLNAQIESEVTKAKTLDSYTVKVDRGRNKKNETINFTTEIRTDRIVFLETKKDCLLGNIEKVIHNEENCYILHSIGSQKEIAIFSCKTGSFIQKISCHGRGPGEYTRIDDFDVLGKQIYLLDSSIGKMLVYTETGQFVKYINCKLYARSMVALNDDLFLLYLPPIFTEKGKEKYALVWIDSSGEIVKKALQIQKNEPQIPKQYVFSKGASGKVIFVHSLYNTVYQVSNLILTPIINIDFGKSFSAISKVKNRNPGEDTDNSNWVTDLEGIDTPYFLFNYFFENPFFIVSYFYNNIVHTVFASTQTGKILDGIRYNSTGPMGFYKLSPQAMFGHSVLFVETALSFKNRLIKDKEKYKNQIPDFANDFKLEEIIKDENFELRNHVLIFAKLNF
jgi:hypothetical protein